MTKNIFAFFRLIALELIVAGSISVTIAARQKYESALVVSVFAILAGVAFFLSAGAVQKQPALGDKIKSFVSSRYGRYILFVPAVFLIVFFFTFKPGAKLMTALAPVLLILWVAGLEFIWFFPVDWHLNLPSQKNGRNWLSFVSLLLIYGFLVIPTSIPTLLDGVIWDQSFEFVIVALLVPLAFIINWPFFAKRQVIVVLIGLILAKLLISSFIPQSGLGVRAFKSQDSYAVGVWEKSYHTWLNPSYTTVMRSPYYSMRELPVEWVNNHFGFNFDEFWVTLELNGTIHIPDDGRFILLVRGASEANFEIIDLNSHTKTSPVVIDNVNKLGENIYHQLPEIKDFQLKGNILLTRFGEARLEPGLVYPDGSIKPVFENAGVWLSSEDTLTQEQIIAFRTILNLLSLIFVGIVSFGSLLGLAELLDQKYLSTADIYLALTGILTYYVAGFIPKPQLPFFLIVLLVIITIVKVIDYKFAPSETSFKSYFVSVGIIFLTTLMILDTSSLRAMTPFPMGQDGLEYQTFARYIYVYGDMFLTQTPPRAYKILFPYVVGLLHVLFGQSTSAQLFLNSWCAILSAAFTFQLAKSLQLPSKLAFPISILLPLILCLPASFIFYYRFGLIEPIAVLFLLMALYFAVTKRLVWMLLSGILAVLFRLDYIGLAFAALLLTAPAMTGSFSQAWKQLLGWALEKWKLITAYLISLCLLPLLIILGYFSQIPNYMLNAGDTHQNSIQTMLESLLRVAFGDTPMGLRARFVENPLDTLVIAAPLACGFFISIAAILFRRGVFSKLDLRWALLIPFVLPPYIAVRPTGYFPRFSFSLLPLDLIMIGLLIYSFSLKLHQSK